MVPNLAHAALGSAPHVAPHRVLVVGGAYGGISAVLNLQDLARGRPRKSWYEMPDLKGQVSKRGVEITVIDERDGFFHSVGAPLAHVSRDYTPKMWKRYSQLNELKQPNLHFKHGSVTKINPSSKTAEWRDRTGAMQSHSYDYLIMATGLKRHWPAVPRSGSHAEYTEDARKLIEKITGGGDGRVGRKIAIIGAGAVGVEFAGEIKANYPSIQVTLIHSRKEVLSSEPLPSEVKDRVKTLLGEEGVELILENRAAITSLPDGKSAVTLTNGTVLTVDLALDTTKKGSPTTDSLPTEVLDDAKEILVTPHLSWQPKVANADSHFGVGDVIAWTGIKRAGGAMVMGQVAATNLYATILNNEAREAGEEAETHKLGELPEYPPVIGIAVGKQCLTWDKGSGVKYGVQLMKDYFQDDLGWAYSLKSLGLTDLVEQEPKEVDVEPIPVDVAPGPVAAVIG